MARKRMERVIKTHKLQQSSKLKQEGNNFHIKLVPLPDVHFTKNFVRVEKFDAENEKYTLFCTIDISLPSRDLAVK